MSNPYQEAYSHVGIVREFVTENLQNQITYANTTRASVGGVLASLSNFNPRLSFDGTPPATPAIDVSIDGDFTLPNIGATAFGSVSGVTAQLGALSAIRDAGGIDIAPFMPSVTGLTLPEVPQMTAPMTAPARPATTAVVLPSSPTIERPAFPSLETISIPAFSFPAAPWTHISGLQLQGRQQVAAQAPRVGMACVVDPSLHGCIEFTEAYLPGSIGVVDKWGQALRFSVGKPHGQSRIVRVGLG